MMNIAIGAYYGINNSGNTTGDVKVYYFNGMSWAQIGQDIVGASPYDNFEGLL